MKQDKHAVEIFKERIKIIKDLDYEVVYMDKSGLGYDMPRLFAHSLKGERAIGYRENHNKQKMNLLGVL